MQDLLATALDHIKRAEYIVVRQEEFVARARTNEWSTTLPEQLLAGSRAMLRTFRAAYSGRLAEVETKSLIDRSRGLVKEAFAASRIVPRPQECPAAAPPVPLWLFLWSAPKRRWAWRSDRSYAGMRFIDLDEAIADAGLHGFNRFLVYWTATRNGRTTHYLPGRVPVNLASSEDLTAW